MTKKCAASIATALFALCVLAASPANATVITFDDDGAYSGTKLANGYGGFNWSNMYAYPGYYMPGTGYDHGTVSGTNIAFNGGGDPASFSKETPFTLVSIEVTKAWYAGMTHFQGFTSAGLTYEMDVYATTLTPVHAVFNWSGVTRIVMSDVISGSSSNQTAIDNLVVSSVPEPETYMMMLAGLGMSAFIARRKTRSLSVQLFSSMQ